MSFLKRLFGSKEEPVRNYNDFWNWFSQNEVKFANVVKHRLNIEKDFLDKISSKLGELKDGYFFLTGMYDDNTVELVLTADSNVGNIVFIEELVAHAPKLAGWKFTALKPALEIKDITIDMGGFKFSGDTLSFYGNEEPGYPDEISITLCHPDLTESNRNVITNGTYIFLEHILGELDFVNIVDEVRVIAKEQAAKELIHLSKLRDFLSWRQKEFVEKYEGTAYDTENNGHSVLQGQLASGNMLIATINVELLEWERKASHPWVGILKIKYDGRNNNGMPDTEDYEMINEIEEKLVADLPDHEGYLNIGRQTADGEREVYFACKDFRKPSKSFFDVQKQLAGKFEVSYEMYKDKYWRSFERFRQK